MRGESFRWEARHTDDTGDGGFHGSRWERGVVFSVSIGEPLGSESFWSLLHPPTENPLTFKEENRTLGFRGLDTLVFTDRCNAPIFILGCRYLYFGFNYKVIRLSNVCFLSCVRSLRKDLF